MGFFVVLIGLVMASVGSHAKTSNECKVWFDGAKILKGKDCLARCLSLKVDLSTMSCADECEELCRTEVPPDMSGYYGLTATEYKFVKKSPAMAAKAYLKSWDAETLCGRLYKVSDTNDESDACRHFVWAALLVEAFGRETADRILDAHEQNPLQPEDEKSMDVANNKIGVSSAEKLLKNKEFSTLKVMEEFRKRLNAGDLTVLKKGGAK